MGGKHGSVFPTFLLSSGRWILCRFKALPCAFPGVHNGSILFSLIQQWNVGEPSQLPVVPIPRWHEKSVIFDGEITRNQWISWRFLGVSRSPWHFHGGTSWWPLPATVRKLRDPLGSMMTILLGMMSGGKTNLIWLWCQIMSKYIWGYFFFSGQLRGISWDYHGLSFWNVLWFWWSRKSKMEPSPPWRFLKMDAQVTTGFNTKKV